MKSFAIMLVSVVVSLYATAAGTGHLDVKVTGPGELGAVLADKAATVESLAVEGPIDERDFATLWECSFEGELRSLDLSKALPDGNAIPDSAFFHEKAQRGPYSTNEYSYNRLKLTELALPENLLRIGNSALRCLLIRSLEIPASVRDLGAYCFARCDSLKEPVALPEGLEAVPEGCFYFCQYMTGITIPASVKMLGEKAFKDCNSMTGAPLIIPEGVTEIPDYCFSGCMAVHEFKLPSTLRSIGNLAFEGLILDTPYMILPEGLEEIGERAFDNNTFLEIDIPASCTELGQMAFMSSRRLRSMRFGSGSSIREIPTGFAPSCDSLTTLVLPDGLVSIGERAFDSCNSLSEIDFPSTLTSIGINAFFGNSIIDLVLPENLEKLGGGCFEQRGSSKLKSICSLNPTPPYIFFSPFSQDLPTDIPVYVPVGAAETYRTTMGWRNFTNIIESSDLPPTVGIGTIVTDTTGEDIPVYDLMGRRVSNPTKGNIYIKSGKKYIH